MIGTLICVTAPNESYCTIIFNDQIVRMKDYPAEDIGELLIIPTQEKLNKFLPFYAKLIKKHQPVSYG